MTQFVSSLEGFGRERLRPTRRCATTCALGLSHPAARKAFHCRRFYYRIGVGPPYTARQLRAHLPRAGGSDQDHDVSLNWIDYAENTIDESVTGPPHLKELDRCDDPDPMRATRHQLAVDATYEILRAALDPTFSKQQKVDAFQNTMAKYSTFDDDRETARRPMDGATRKSIRWRTPSCCLSRRRSRRGQGGTRRIGHRQASPLLGCHNCGSATTTTCLAQFTKP